MRNRYRRQASGFSLIELLVVIAIILVISAIAIPRLLRSRILANETSAVASLRTICTVQVNYESTYKVGYAPSLAALSPPAGGTAPSAANAGLIDVILAGGTKSGYVFTYNPVDSNGDTQVDTWTITAAPFVPGQTGDKYFFVDLSNVIRFNVGAPANVTSTPIPP